MSAGVLLGRAVSGLLGEFAGWRTVFMFAVALNLLLMATIYRAFPATRPSSSLPYPQLIMSLWQLLKDHPTLRAACARLPFGARTLAVVAETGAAPALRRIGDADVVTVGSLEQLPAALRKVLS